MNTKKSIQQKPQPIKTAPKDGRLVMVYFGSRKCGLDTHASEWVPLCYEDGYWRDCNGEYYEPSHWLPPIEKK